MLSTIKKAIIRRQDLEIIYLSTDGKISQRTIKPFKIVNNGLILTYCYLRQARRTFNIDRILAIVPVSSYTKDVISFNKNAIYF